MTKDAGTGIMKSLNTGWGWKATGGSPPQTQKSFQTIRPELVLFTP